MQAVRDAAYTEPRPIQAKAMPPALKGRDVLGLAQTGTGKTAAFVLPILQRLLSEHRPGPRALVVAPTRELATQVHTEFERLARHTRLKSTAVFGGVPIPRQIRALSAKPDVVVACPGRLLDLLNRGALRLDGIEVLVLDEADHMFDMGFLPDVRRILRALPRRRQNLMYSATMPREIRKLADTVLERPAVVELGDSKPAETIDHALYPLDESEKVGALESLLTGEGFRSAIVFLRTKRRARRLAEHLDGRGHRAVALQGNMSQGQRERALLGFREKRYDVLVATDIAARGLDIANISHVVNYDVPNTPDAYTHRIGRTGRSEQAGTAFTFVTPDDREALRAIEKRLGAAIERRRSEELGPLAHATLSRGKNKGRAGGNGRSRSNGHAKADGQAKANGGARSGAFPNDRSRVKKPSGARGRGGRSRRSFSEPAVAAVERRPAPVDRPAFGLGVVDEPVSRRAKSPKTEQGGARG